MSLRQIRGIGPKTEEIIRERGITTVRELAGAHPDELSDIPGGRSFIIRAREIVGDLSWKTKKVEARSGSGEGITEVYEFDVEYSDDIPRELNTWNPRSPYAGHPVDPAVKEAVAHLQEEDKRAGRPMIMTNHVLTFRDYGDRVVLSCEPGGKRIYYRD